MKKTEFIWVHKEFPESIILNGRCGKSEEYVKERMCKLAFGQDMLPECSECGEPLNYYTLRHGLSKNRRSANYCPNCGALVVGE